MKTQKLALAFAACAATALMAGSASAGVGIKWFPYGMGAPVLQLVTNFSTDTLGKAPTKLPAGYTWSKAKGVTYVQDKSKTNFFLQPALSASTFHKGNYLAIETNSEEDLKVSSKLDITRLAFYMGSLDDYNEVIVDYMGGSATFTGAQLLAASLGTGNDHSPTSGTTNGEFELLASKPITEVQFIDTSKVSAAFEIADIYASSSVPEPAVWLMSILGLAMIGGMARRRALDVAFA